MFLKGTEEEMEKLLKEAKTGKETKRIQCVLLRAKGLTSEQIGIITGYHCQHVRRVWQQYKGEGLTALIGEKRGMMRRKAYLSTEEEKTFLSSFIKKANTSGMLIVSEVHEAHKKKVGKDIPLGTTYNLLHRHGWRKIVPRPSHPKSNTEAQKDYKTFLFPPESHQGKN